MADVLVTELLIDASGALAGATEFEAASNRIVAASARAAAAADTVGEASLLSATAAAKAGESGAVYAAGAAKGEAAAAAQEQALLRQVIAASGATAALEALTRVNKEVESAQLAAAAVIQALPTALSAVGTEIEKLSQSHAGLLTNVEKMAARQAELSATISAFPGIVGSAASSTEKYAASHLETAAAVAAGGAAHRAAITPIRELHEEVEHGHMTIRQEHGLWEAFRASLTGDVSQAISSTSQTLQRFHIIQLATTPAFLGTLASIAAIGGVAFLAGERLNETQSQLLQFGTSARTLGTDSLATAENLHKMFEQIRDMGLGAAQAEQIINLVRLSPLINPQAALPIARVGAGLSAMETGGLDAAAKDAGEFTKALEGGLEATIKFAQAHGLLREAEAAQFLEASRVNGVMETQQNVFELVTSRIEPAGNSLTKTREALISLNDAWQHLRDTLADSAFAALALRGLTLLITGLEKLISGIDFVLIKAGQLRELVFGPSETTPHGGGESGSPAAPGTAILGTDVATGRASWFGPWPGHPEWADAMNAGQPNASGASLSTPGIALYDRSTLGKWFVVQGPDGKAFVLPQVDVGPAPWTGKGIDINAPAASQMGFSPGTFPTGGRFSWRPATQEEIASGTAGAMPQVSGVTPGSQAAQLSAVQEAIDASRRRLEVDDAVGVQQQLLRAAEEAHTQALKVGLSATAEKVVRDTLYNEIIKKNNIDLEHQTTVTNMTAQGTRNAADANLSSEAAGIRANAVAQAQLATYRNLGPTLNQNAEVQRLAAANLEAQASSAYRSATGQVAALTPAIEANKRLAEATLQGADAARQMQINNDATKLTHNTATEAEAAHTQAIISLKEAELSGNQALIQEAQAREHRTQVLLDDSKALLANAEAQLSANAAYQNATTMSVGANRFKDEVASLQLEIGLQGQTTEQIRSQLDLLHVRQQIENQRIHTDDPIAAAAQAEAEQNLTRQAERAVDYRIALSQAQQSWGRINDAARSVADTISNQLSTALDDAFSGKKVEDWGATLKQILRDILKQIVEFTLIKPALGTALGALGFGEVAKQFGSFPGLGGSSSGGIGDALGGIGKLLGIGGGGSATGAGSYAGLSASELADLGVSAGTGTSVGAGGFAGMTAGELADIGVPAAGGGGLLSGLGGIGSALGSALPFIGPAIGVASLIGGLLGNKKPSNNASGAEIDLATGALTGSSGGVAANDSALKQITDQLTTFNKSIQQLTGGTAAGVVGAQVGTRDGTKITYRGPGGEITSTDVNAIELQIAQNLTNVSDTLRTVLAHITDPSQVADAVKFAATYDALKTAADSAFASISTDTKLIGPYQTAFESLNKTFADLTTQANAFGLSLDPINAGLAEATRRLQDDFGKALDQALGTATGNDFLNGLTTVSQTFATNTRDAQAIGLGSDAATANKISQLEIAQAQAILGGLTVDQLHKVVDAFGSSNPEIAAMAQDLLNMGGAANAAAGATQNAATALKDLATGIKSIEDLAQSLRTGPLSGLTPAAAAAAKGGEFQAALATVQGAGTAVTGAQLSTLSAAGQAAIEASRTAYGEGPQTADLRKSILGSLGAVTAVTGTSAAANAAAASPASLVASPAVQSAQNAAAAAALRAAGVPGFASGGSAAPGWFLAGEAGPELVYTSGGASVVPINSHAAYQWRGPSYAGGTGDFGALLMEMMALRRQLQGGQKQAAEDASKSHRELSGINRKSGPGITEPRRQRLA